MDWADDVAYSVHDLEDAVHSGHLRLDALRDPAERAAVAACTVERHPALTGDDVQQAARPAGVAPGLAGGLRRLAS